MEFSWQSLAFYFGFILLVKGENLAQRCSLFISEIPDCITCNVQESSKEEFDLHFKNDSFYHNDCQTQINAKFNSIVFENTTNQYYIMTSLYSELSTIHHTKKILFRVNYSTQGSSIAKNSFFSADVSFGGSHRADLPKMRIPLPLENVDIGKPIDVKSHSMLACAGLHSEFQLIPLSRPISNVHFEAVDLRYCKYLNVKHLGTRQPKPLKDNGEVGKLLATTTTTVGVSTATPARKEDNWFLELITIAVASTIVLFFVFLALVLFLIFCLTSKRKGAAQTPVNQVDYPLVNLPHDNETTQFATKKISPSGPVSLDEVEPRTGGAGDLTFEESQNLEVTV